MKFSIWDDGGSGWYELSDTIDAPNAKEAAALGSDSVRWNWVHATEEGMDPNDDDKVILASHRWRPVRKLPNGVVIRNSTPHLLRFWAEGWDAPVVVERHGLISARPQEDVVSVADGVEYVSTTFVGNDEGKAIIADVNRGHPEAVVVGSIIAAQAYPGDVVSPCLVKRDHPDKVRVRPDKFTVF